MISACCEVLWRSLVASQKIEICFTCIICQERATGAKLGKVNIGGNRGSICPPRVQDHCKGQYEKSSDRKTDHCRAFLCRTRPVRKRHLSKADALFRRNRQFPRARGAFGSARNFCGRHPRPHMLSARGRVPSFSLKSADLLSRETLLREAMVGLSLQLFVAAGSSSEPSHRIPDYQPRFQRRWRFW